MYQGKKVWVIITAAGKGKRMGGGIPKQYMKIGDETVLERAISPFQNNNFVDCLIVTAGAGYIQDTEKLCAGFTKIEAVVCGGKERQDSVWEGLKRVGDGLVLIHDGARPYVTQEVINNVITATFKSGAAVAAVSCKDTVRSKLSDAGETTHTLNRNFLYNVQTPQGFNTDIIKAAFKRAREDGFTGTDDSILAERAGYGVAIAEGSYENIKITTKEDLPRMQSNWCKTPFVGIGYDVHRLCEGRACMLCGVKIPYERGLLGHSDADVSLHALMDAMLGAAALGDIGKFFPDNDEKYRGISSIELLKKVKEIISNKGFTFGNGDITIIAQEPKIAPYINQMREKIAEALEADVTRINVKGTTTEKLGFAGRGEGIAAEAVCILYKSTEEIK